MMHRTTIAHGLFQVFLKLNSRIPTTNDGTALFTTWSAILGGNNRTEFDVMESMGELLRAIHKLELQIKASEEFDEISRASALSLTGSFKPLFGLQNLLAPATNFKSACSQLAVGQLKILGLSLQHEFSEPTLSSTETETIAKALEEVKSLLQDSTLPIDLRVSLTKHVDAMLWWLTHPDFLGMQDIFEKTATAVVIAEQLRDRLGEDKKEPALDIAVKLKAVFKIVASSMGFLVRNAENIERLESTARQLLS